VVPGPRTSFRVFNTWGGKHREVTCFFVSSHFFWNNPSTPPPTTPVFFFSPLCLAEIIEDRDFPPLSLFETSPSVPDRGHSLDSDFPARPFMVVGALSDYRGAYSSAFRRLSLPRKVRIAFVLLTEPADYSRMRALCQTVRPVPWSEGYVRDCHSTLRRIRAALTDTSPPNRGVPPPPPCAAISTDDPVAFAKLINLPFPVTGYPWPGPVWYLACFAYPGDSLLDERGMGILLFL